MPPLDAIAAASLEIRISASGRSIRRTQLRRVLADLLDLVLREQPGQFHVLQGALQNVKLTRLFTQDEIKQVRQNAAKLRSSYTPPGG